MTVCANRRDEPGFFTSCVLAAGKCRCGESVRAEDAAAASDATPAGRGGNRRERVVSDLRVHIACDDCLMRGSGSGATDWIAEHLDLNPGHRVRATKSGDLTTPSHPDHSADGAESEREHG